MNNQQNNPDENEFFIRSSLIVVQKERSKNELSTRLFDGVLLKKVQANDCRDSEEETIDA